MICVLFPAVTLPLLAYLIVIVIKNDSITSLDDLLQFILVLLLLLLTQSMFVNYNIKIVDGRIYYGSIFFKLQLSTKGIRRIGLTYVYNAGSALSIIRERASLKQILRGQPILGFFRNQETLLEAILEVIRQDSPEAVAAFLEEQARASRGRRR